jgi:hypothetical protein
MPTGGVQAEAIYLPFFVTDFDCGRARGGEGFIRTHGGIDCIIAVGYRVPFRQKKRLRFPVFRAAGVIAAVL